MNSQTDIDALDWRILAVLQRDARTSMTALAKQVHLSAPATTERVRRLEERGVICGYHARVNSLALGYSICALIRVSCSNGIPLAAKVADMPEILECHIITGRECVELKAVFRDVQHLDTVLKELMLFGETSTAIVLRTEKLASEVARP
jgi:Lrp/AsnC family leucine-responsive transcriptional regulator